MKLFTRSKGRNKERTFVFGEDRRITEKALVSTGAFFLDPDESFAYDSLPDTMGTSITMDPKGNLKHNGQCVILYETSAQPWRFSTGKWVEETPSMSNLLRDGRMEGMGAVSATIEDDNRIAKMMPILWFILCIFLLITVIACASGGLFDKLGEVF